MPLSSCTCAALRDGERNATSRHFEKPLPRWPRGTEASTERLSEQITTQDSAALREAQRHRPPSTAEAAAHARLERLPLR